MAEALEVNGIVLSVMPIGEADRRVVLLTRELGRISAFARGARRPTSALVGCTRTFAFGRFRLYPGRDSYTLASADIQSYFEEIVRDVEKTAYGCYFLELSSMFTREGADATDALLLLYYALKALSNEALSDRLVRRVFELKTLALNGLLADFSVCAVCRKPLVSGLFLPSMMRPVCPDCAGDAYGFPLSKGAVYALNFLRGVAPGKLFTFRVSDEVLSELGRLSDYLLERETDRKPASLSMLQVLAPDDNNA